MKRISVGHFFFGFINNFFTAGNLYDGNNLNFSIVRYPPKKETFSSITHIFEKKKKQNARLGKHLGLQPMISNLFALLSYLQSGVMALPL